MMNANISRPLYEGTLLCLAAPDPEHDAGIEAGWSNDAAYRRFLDVQPARPLSKAQIQKRYESAQNRDSNEILLAVRTQADNCLVGFARFYWIAWARGYAMFRYAFGDHAVQGDEYAQELVQLLLRYAFDEIGFYRVHAEVASDEADTIRVLEAAGFRLEVRQRLAIQHHGQRWDLLTYGLLADEWRQPATHDLQAEPWRAETLVRPGGATAHVSMNGSLAGPRVRLAAPDAERDAPVLTGWARNSEFVRMLDSDPAQPWSLAGTRKELEEMASRERPNSIHLMIRILADDQAIGFISLGGINWVHGSAWVGIGIGDPAFWSKGYGTEAMQLLLHYAFDELNLYRVSLNVFEYNERAVRSYVKSGFVVEGRARRMFVREGRRWDFIYMGILRDEWASQLAGQMLYTGTPADPPRKEKVS
jgi:RimJ/RimL family protein N-acetyltransferase